MQGIKIRIILFTKLFIIFILIPGTAKKSNKNDNFICVLIFGKMFVKALINFTISEKCFTSDMKKCMEPFESRLCGKLQIVFPWNFLCKIVKKRNFRLKYSVSLKLLTPIFLNPVSLILRQFPNKTRVFPSFFPFSHQQNLTPKISLAILKNRNLIFTLCSASILSILSL